MAKEDQGRTEFFECRCHTDEHTIKFRIDDYNEEAELYTSVYLNQYRSFFKRLWVAIKYVFGYRCKYGHWDCTLIKSEDVDRLIKICQNFKELDKKYNKELYK